MPIDDAKIDLIAREVLTSLKKSRAESAAHAAHAVTPSAPDSPTPQTQPPHRPFHLQLLSVAGGVVGSPCVIEPDKICDASLRCRSLGH